MPTDNWFANLEDREMMKWGGFFLSEQTARQERYNNEQIKPVQKNQMPTTEINTIIQTALLKNLPVSIQIEAIDMDGNYFPNINGFIKGYDELGFYVNDTKVVYVKLDTLKFWRQLSGLIAIIYED